MPKATTIQRLWEEFDSLKVALHNNPHPQIKKAQKIITQMELTIKTLRREEIREQS